MEKELFHQSLLYEIVPNITYPHEHGEFTLSRSSTSNIFVTYKNITIATIYSTRILRKMRLMIYSGDHQVHLKFCETFNILPFSYCRYGSVPYFDESYKDCTSVSYLRIREKYRIVDKSSSDYDVCVNFKNIFDITGELNNEMVALRYESLTCDRKLDDSLIVGFLKDTYPTVKYIIIYKGKEQYYLYNVTTNTGELTDSDWKYFVRDYYINQTRFRNTKSAKNTIKH
jgi:hypothetical protein